MKKIKYTFFTIVVLAVILSVYIFSLDDSFTVKRSRIIKAPANLVYNQIANLKNWEKWSPWKEKDSLMKFEFSNTTNKEGDYLRFTDEKGNPQKITHISIKPDSVIIQTMGNQEQMQDFYWKISSVDNGTRLTWTVKGELPLMQRFYAKEMDAMIGPLLTRGLERIDKAVHEDMEKHTTEIDTIVDLGTTYYLYKTASCKMDNLGKTMDSILPQVLLYAIKNHIKMNGKPFTVYEKYDLENNSVIFSSCIPTMEKIEVKKEDILTGKTPGGKYLRAIYKGDYKFLPEAWQQTYEYLQKNDSLVRDQTRFSFEIYTKGHTLSPNPADWVTEIYIPVIIIDSEENTSEND